MKIKYQTLETRVRKKTNSGTKKVPVYIRKLDENGQPKMKIKEYFNIYADIQTYKDDNNILKIASKLGMKPEELDFNQGRNYIDMRKIPDNYNDIMNQRTDIFADYLKLPIDFKKLLENNFDIYYGLVMNGKAEDIINKYQKGELNINDLKGATKIEKGGKENAILQSTENEQKKDNIQT